MITDSTMECTVAVKRSRDQLKSLNLMMTNASRWYNGPDKPIVMKHNKIASQIKRHLVSSLLFIFTGLPTSPPAPPCLSFSAHSTSSCSPSLPRERNGRRKTLALRIFFPTSVWFRLRSPIDVHEFLGLSGETCEASFLCVVDLRWRNW